MKSMLSLKKQEVIEMSEWLNTEEAAKHLGISASNLYTLAQQGRIPSNRIGKVWRFSRNDLDIWVRANKPINEFFLNAEAFIDENDLLREPQRDGYAAAYDFFSNAGKKAIIQLPVGCGKTGLISILPFGISMGRVLVIAPNLTIREELQKNLDITNRRYCFWSKCDVLKPEAMAAGPYVAVLDGKDANIHDCDQSHIVLTNIQQLASSADKWLPAFSDDYFDLIMVDEGHHSAAPSWKKVFEKFPKAKIVNLTATPFRSDNKDIDGDLIYRYSFKSAMLKGYIKKLQATYIAPDRIYFTYKGSERHHTLEEVLELKEEDWFSKGVALAPECNKHIVDASLDKLEILRQTGTHHQLIAVACSVAHAKAIRSLYSERGYSAQEIHSNMPLEKREEVLHKLKAGLLDCIIQVQMLGEGFDHPKLSVGAIFRPFRALSPYVQFVGRIMRIIVQHDARHPDNYGFIVSHVGLNLDSLLEDFRELEREDQTYFNDLIEGMEPEPPKQVLEGRGRQKLTEDMVVNQEFVTTLFEEEFIDQDDMALLDELKAQAERLGFDAEKIEKAIRGQQNEKVRRVNVPESLPVPPQARRREARKRLNEEVKRTANLLLNRLDLKHGGRELALKYCPGTTGINLVAAIQSINSSLNKELNIKSGQKGTLNADDFISAQESLIKILDDLTTSIKGRMKRNG